MESATNNEPQIPPARTEKTVDSVTCSDPTERDRFWRTPILWFRSLTIERRILSGFGLVFVGILVISAVSYRNASIVVDNSGRDTRSHELVQLLSDIDEAMDEAENNHRRYLVTGDGLYLTSYRSVIKQKPMFLKYLTDLTAGSLEQQERVGVLSRMMDRQVAAETESIELLRNGGFEAVKKMALEGAAKNELIEIHRLVGEMELYERESLRRRVIESAAVTTNTIVLLGIGAVLQLVLLASVYYLIRHDITERRRVAEELQRRGTLLEAANQELESFSYSVSHDLRAPLRHIDGYASLLRKAAADSLNEKAGRYLDTISASAKQMGQLIDDLLVFSRMGRQEMLRTTVDLNNLITMILSDLRLDLQGRDISWTIEPLPQVPGDSAMLRQVFMNLIANAVKFTSTRPKAEIAIGIAQQTTEEVVVFVRDNGVGFNMEYVSKLFGVFQRLHRIDEFDGTGIGLANVRRIVHRHGGRTWAEGAIEQGATFYVGLPTRRIGS